MIADIIIAILIGAGCILGYKRGLLVELVTLLAFVIALISAFKLLHTTISFLNSYFITGSLSVLISFILVFTLVFVLIFLLGKALKGAINMTILGVIDNIAGALIGGLKAAFAISMIIWLAHNAHIDRIYIQETKDAYFYPYLINFGPDFIKWISNVIPFKDIFPSIKRLLN